MADLPYLSLWTDAYIADTTHLTNEEHGVYLRLLMSAWRSGRASLPNDEKRLRLMVGMSVEEWDSVRDAILAFFTVEDGRLVQKRLRKEWDTSVARKESGRKGGRTTQANRQAKPKQTSKQTLKRKSSLPSPSPSPSLSSDPSPDSCAEFIRLPLVGNGAGEAIITSDQVEGWKKSFPDVNVVQQLRNIREWLIHNPKRRKTDRGIGRFVVGWLSKEQDKGRKGDKPTLAEQNFAAAERVAAKYRREESNGK